MILRQKSALTLVEMMISTLIFTAVVASLYTLFSSGKFSWATYENRIIVQREARQALARMGKELREASGIAITQSAGNTTLNFTREDQGAVVYQWNDTGADANRILRTLDGTTTILANSISLLSFASDATSITIDITATKALWGGGASSFHLKQKVALRED